MDTNVSNSWEQGDMQAVCHGCTDLGTLNAEGPVILTHGDGIRVFDVHGKSYIDANSGPVSYTHLRAHETVLDLVCRLLLEKKKKTKIKTTNPLAQHTSNEIIQHQPNMHKQH